MTAFADDKVTWESALSEMKAFSGKSVKGVDTSTLRGKIVTGYQGWFNTPNDGAGLNWKHYSGKGGKFEPGTLSVDFWPHTAEFQESSLEETSSEEFPCGSDNLLRIFFFTFLKALCFIHGRLFLSLS